MGKILGLIIMLAGVAVMANDPSIYTYGVFVFLWALGLAFASCK